MRLLTTSSCFITLMSVGLGCVTARSTNNNKAKSFDYSAATQDKMGSKSIDEEKLSASYFTNQHQLLQFITAQSQKNSSLSESDLALVESLPPSPTENSLEEAALVIGTLKKTMQGTLETKNYEESNLLENSDSNNAALKRTSLEKRFQQKGLDLAKALSQNTLLKNYEIYSLALQLSRQTTNSSKFMNDITAVVNTQVQAWTSLPTVGTFVGVRPIEENSATPPSNVAVPISDSILVEAQNLADNKHYIEAIKKASMIEEGNPLYDVAQQKIVSFSNDGVQDLRQKAALAFQNALPVSDPKAKATYLNLARKHLEQALEKYPRAPADQLKTVRENLSVISRDLERLSSSVDIDNSDQKAQLR